LNQKGVMFTLMAFILLTTLLSLNEIRTSHDRALSEGETQKNAFKNVSSKFSNIESNIITLASNDAEREIDQRILPFEYAIDQNRFETSFTLPIKKERTDAYLEVLNAMKVFIEDANYSNQFDSQNVDLNILTPSLWGGSDTNISFIIEPQCIKYSILDGNIISFEFVCSGFDYNAVTRQDINIILGQAHDFNSIACSFNGNNNCFSDPFDPLDTRPYLNVNIDSIECINCALGQTAISGHFDPNQTSNITMSCIGIGCVNPDLSMDFSNMTVFEYHGLEFDFEYAIDLNSQIEGFRFNDANILVENRDFGAKRWS